MHEHERIGPKQPLRSAPVAPRSSLPAPNRQPGLSPARALALQRAVGNRAVARTLSRWAVHPDKEKKGMFVPDTVAADYLKFNPPKNQ